MIRPRSWLPSTGLLFLLGGAIQFAGLLSQTQTNFVVLCILFGTLGLRKSAYRQLSKEWLLACFVLWLLLVQLSHGRPLDSTATYVYYVLCMAVAAVAGRIFCLNWIAVDVARYVRVVKAFLVLQAVVTTLQSFFADALVAQSRAPLGKEDAVFGTLYLQSDASLGAVCLLALTSFFILPTSWRDKLFAMAAAGVVVYNANSQAIKGAYLLVITLLVCSKVGLASKRTGRVAVIAALPIAALAVLSWIDIDRAVGGFIETALDGFDSRYTFATASRWAPLGHMLSESISLSGGGALTYYNPITRSWMYNAGFSTVYSLYFDFGLIGLLLVTAYFGRSIVSNAKRPLIAVVIGVTVVSFAFFNFAMTDMAFIFSLAAVCQLQGLRFVPKDRRYANG